MITPIVSPIASAVFPTFELMGAAGIPCVRTAGVPGKLIGGGGAKGLCTGGGGAKAGCSGGGGGAKAGCSGGGTIGGVSGTAGGSGISGI